VRDRGREGGVRERERGRKKIKGKRNQGMRGDREQ